MKKRWPAIVLIGFMGAGKSSVGKRLARQLGWCYFDTDEMIEKRLGMSISKIFAQLGEARFRREESLLLREIKTEAPAIIVTGGGIVLRRGNVRRLRQLGNIVWLKAEPEVLKRRLAGRKNRPLLQSTNVGGTIAKLMEQRKEFYQAAADFVVDTTRLSQKQVIEAVCDAMSITC